MISNKMLNTDEAVAMFERHRDECTELLRLVEDESVSEIYFMETEIGPDSLPIAWVGYRDAPDFPGILRDVKNNLYSKVRVYDNSYAYSPDMGRRTPSLITLDVTVRATVKHLGITLMDLYSQARE